MENFGEFIVEWVDEIFEGACDGVAAAAVQVEAGAGTVPIGGARSEVEQNQDKKKRDSLVNQSIFLK